MDSGTPASGPVRIALQFGIGVVLVAYGVALFTDTVPYRPPAAIYFAVGIGLLGYGLWQVRESGTTERGAERE